MNGRGLITRRSLLWKGAAGLLATAVSSFAALTSAHGFLDVPKPKIDPCAHTYIADEWLYVNDNGTVLLCQDLHSVSTDEYCFTRCTQCG